jgi:hypothetical protein
MGERERILWTMIRRGLMLVVAAIDQYLAQEQPSESRR